MSKQTLSVTFAITLCSVMGWALQVADVAEKLGYPQMVLHNAKIVTVDDRSFESRVGTIVQAMAVRDGKILATGTDAEIQSLAGPQTKMIDLKGRTVLPGFIMTHEHPTDWAFQEPRAITHVLPPNNEILVHRWLPCVSAKDQLGQLASTMQEALQNAKPGQWIQISFNDSGTGDSCSGGVQELFSKSVAKEWLDQLAPRNPVMVKNGFITSVLNQRAIDEVKAVYPTFLVISETVENSMLPLDQWLKKGLGYNRNVAPDVVFKDKLPALAQILKAELELWASYGITTIGSAAYAYKNLHAFDYLDKTGEMPARFGWGYVGPDWDMDTLRYLGGMLGHGTDHLWFVGAWGRSGGYCQSVPLRSEWVAENGQLAAEKQTLCLFAPGSPYRERMENIIKAGLRIATMHSHGDKEIDYLMDIIEQASQDTGLSLEDIRAKRHAFDHGGGAPRPDQIPRMKKLGMMASQNNSYLAGDATVKKVEMYGIEYANWVVPRKSMAEGGVMTTAEIDRPHPEKVFPFIAKGMNRISDVDGKVYGPRERTDRIVQLKAHTRWGAYYMLREDLLGTLEPGKFADFIVLDKDFLTIPEDQIPNIRVLMTAVGGKLVHLASSLAKEIGMQPVGATTWKEEIPSGW